MVNISILRIGHRIERDKRLSTHVGLVARAFGADKLYYTGQKDSGMEESIEKIRNIWGGFFEVEHIKSWRKFIPEFKGIVVHLTMYGLPFQKELEWVKKEGKDVLIVLGGQKVPGEVYELADFNLAVTNQPHSEAGALSVFLDRFFEGKELEIEFEGAERRIVPKEKGKKVIKK
ncbi:MAG: tRNA (cytidine(56)-2'-O)-methyltransferase [Candidatus Undinarchaeales archaeon]